MHFETDEECSKRYKSALKKLFRTLNTAHIDHQTRLLTIFKQDKHNVKYIHAKNKRFELKKSFTNYAEKQLDKMRKG